jgi:hypothetical protein
MRLTSHDRGPSRNEADRAHQSLLGTVDTHIVTRLLPTEYQSCLEACEDFLLDGKASTFSNAAVESRITRVRGLIATSILANEGRVVRADLAS